MRRFHIVKPITSGILLFLVLFLFSGVAQAVYRHEFSPTGQVLEERSERVGTPSAKKDEAKIKVCERKARNIENRSKLLVARAEKIENRFDRIVTRVKEYYENRLRPKGVVVENYDALLANIGTKMEATHEALEKAKDLADDFNCDGDVRAQTRAFKEAMHEVISSLNAYKNSVIDFLVAVRTKGKNIPPRGATPSATPSAD